MTKKKKAEEYIYAYDPVIRRRVVHVIINDYAVSLITGHKFKYQKHFKKFQ